MQGHKFLYLVILCVLASCSAKKFVPQNELLYVKPEVKIEHLGKSKNKGGIESKVDEILRPEPVTSFLGSRTGLWLWYKYSKPGEHPDSGSWVKRKFVKEPVYYSQANPEAIVKAINAAFNFLTV